MANGQELQQLSIGLWTIKPISNTRWQIAQLEGSGDGWGVRMVPEAAELFWWAIESHWEHYGDRPLWGID